MAAQRPPRCPAATGRVRFCWVPLGVLKVSGMEIAKTIGSAEERVRAAVPIARGIYPEPDTHRCELRSGQAVVGGAGSWVPPERGDS